MNGGGPSVVINPISWRVDVLGLARHVRVLACRLIAQIADQVRISAAGPAVWWMSGGERQELTGDLVLEASIWQGIHSPAKTPGNPPLYPRF